MLYHLLGDGLHHFVIRQQQIVAAHARLPRQAGGDHYYVRIRGRLIIVRAGDAHVVAFNRAGLEHVQPFSDRHSFHHVDQHDVRKLFEGDIQGAARAHISAAYHGHFIAHRNAIIAYLR